jgi:uncharacterized membrane protein YkoI
MARIRSKLVTAAAVGAAAVGGAAIASAATSGNASSSSSASSAGSGAARGQGRPQHDPSQAGHTFNGKTEKLLSGDVASKVRAAALAKVPGTVERVETNVDSGAPYEAHIRKSDGTEVEVQVGSDYAVSAVNDMGNRHP